ncbi:MAG: NhaP-type Na+/H+ or K+/H+ antiporter [Planctomycetota bacterium]
MSPETILQHLVLIAVVGVAAQWLAWRLHLPSILLLLAGGILVGPVLGLLQPEVLFGPMLHPLISLAVAVILFEGGLTLELKELRQIGRALFRLATVGVACTWLLATLGAHGLAGLSWPLAILFGAIMTVTGPTVIQPLLWHVRPKGNIGPVAKWEGILADVIGASLAVLVFHAQVDGRTFEDGAASHTMLGLLKTLGTGVLMGLLGAVVLGVPLRRRSLPDALQAPYVLAAVLATFAASHHLSHESGLLAVTLMGFVLANMRGTQIGHIVEFKENLRTLLLSSLFVVLAAGLQLEELRTMSLGSFGFVAFLILIVRPAAVLLSTLGTELSKKEVVFLAWFAPRGVVCAAVASLFGALLADPAYTNGNPIPEAASMSTLAFLVIICTVTVYGLTAKPLARYLGLAEADPQGCLLVGAGPFASQLAHVLSGADYHVVLVDTNRQSISTAKLAGLTAIWGSVLSEDAHDRVPREGLGRLLALTPNDEVNNLCSMHFQESFGRASVYQLPAGGASRDHTTEELRGRELFHQSANFEELAERVHEGARVRLTTLSDTFDFQAFMEHHGDDVVPLMCIKPDRHLIVFTSETPPQAAPGDQVVSLIMDSEAS